MQADATYVVRYKKTRFWPVPGFVVWEDVDSGENGTVSIVDMEARYNSQVACVNHWKKADHDFFMRNSDMAELRSFLHKIRPVIDRAKELAAAVPMIQVPHTQKTISIGAKDYSSLPQLKESELYVP